MKHFKEKIISEINFIRKDLNIILIILSAPLFYALFYGSIYLNKSEKNVPVAVVDLDKSELSRAIVKSLNNHQLINVEYSLADLQSAKSLLLESKVHGIILIPNDFSKQIKSRKGGDINLFLNTTRFLVSNDINKAVNEVISTYRYGIRLKYFETKGINKTQALNYVEPVRPAIHSMFNVTESYGDFLIPGVLILILQQTLLIGLSESIAKEREINSFSTLTNGNIYINLMGKAAIYIFIFSAYALFFFSVILNLFGLEYKGSIISGTVLTLLFFLSIAEFTLFIGSFFGSKKSALSIIAFFSYPIFLISGYSWKLSSMPQYLRPVSNLIPSTPYLSGMTRLITSGAGFGNIFPEFIILSAQIILWYILIQIRYKKLLTKLREV